MEITQVQVLSRALHIFHFHFLVVPLSISVFLSLFPFTITL